MGWNAPPGDAKSRGKWLFRTLGMSNVVVSFVLFTAFTGLYLVRVSSQEWRDGPLQSVFLTTSGDSGISQKGVYQKTQEPYRITNFVTVSRLQAFMYAGWIVLARELQCGSQVIMIGSQGQVNRPDIASPVCKCAYDKFRVHFNISRNILSDAVVDFGGVPAFNNTILLNKLDEINGIKTGAYADEIMRCFASGRETFVTYRVGVSEERPITLNSYVIIICMLATSCFTSLPSVYITALNYFQSRGLAQGCWWTLYMFVLFSLMLVFIVTDERLWALLIFYTGVLFLDSVCKLLEGYALKRTVWKGVWNDDEKKKEVEKNNINFYFYEVSPDLFWVGYIIQLPLMSMLADVVTHRRDITVLASGIVVSMCIAVLSYALATINGVYVSCSGEAHKGKEEEQKGSQLLKLPDIANGKKEEWRIIVENVNHRSLGLVWSGAVVLWGIILGKIGMRYFVDAPFLQDVPRDERYMTEALLFLYSALPTIDLPHIQHYMLGWRGGKAASTLFKTTAEKGILLLLVITWVGLMY